MLIYSKKKEALTSSVKWALKLKLVGEKSQSFDWSAKTSYQLPSSGQKNNIEQEYLPVDIEFKCLK